MDNYSILTQPIQTFKAHSTRVCLDREFDSI